jgi:hypothetical protein
MSLVREQHTVEIDGDTFLITALGTTAGFETLSKLQEMGEGNKVPDPLFLKKLIMTSVTMNNIQFDEKKYELTFSRKHKTAIQLFWEIINFNFEGLNDPNAESGTSEA